MGFFYGFYEIDGELEQRKLKKSLAGPICGVTPQGQSLATSDLL